MFDAEALGAELADLVKSYVDAEVALLRGDVMGLRRQVSELVDEIALLQHRPDKAEMDASVKQLSDALESRLTEFARGLQPDTAYVDEQTSGLRADVAELRTQLAALPEPEPVPDVQRLVDEVVAGLPVAKDGEPGKDADLDVVRAWIAEEVAKIPTPEDGKSITLADIAPLVSETVQRAVEALPVAKDGRDGKDAAQMVSTVKDHTGTLIVTYSDGSVVNTGIRDGTDGKDGAPGPAGLGFDDMDVESRDEGRTIVLAFERGDLRQSFELGFPVVIYRGVYKDDQAYERGDMVSRGGNLYHCNAPTTDKPEGGSEAWTLSARRGRDGKDGAPGPKGEPGQKGDPGLNGRNWT